LEGKKYGPEDIGVGVEVEDTTGVGGADGGVGVSVLSSNSAIIASKVIKFWGFGLKTVTTWETVGSRSRTVKSESWGGSGEDR